jgi:predicted restriction endonuclease
MNEIELGNLILHRQASAAQKLWQKQKQGQANQEKLFFNKEVRRRGIERQYKHCCVCGFSPAELAHLKPKKDGGKYSLDNITPLCPNCHTKFDTGIMKRKHINLITRFINKILGKIPDNPSITDFILPEYNYIKSNLLTNKQGMEGIN